MQTDSLLAVLSRVALFQGLSSMQLLEIARCAEPVTIHAGHAIIADGDTGTAAYLLVSGAAVRLRDDDEADDEVVEPGSLIGEMAMLIDVEHSSTIAARGQVQALKISRDALADVMAEQPDLAEHFVDAVSGRLRAMAYALHQIDRSLTGGASGPLAQHYLPAAQPVARHLNS